MWGEHRRARIAGGGSLWEIFWRLFRKKRASLIAQLVKNPLAMQETWIQPLGQEDPLEKEMTTHSSILAYKIPWTEEPSKLQSMGLQRVFIIVAIYSSVGKESAFNAGDPSSFPGSGRSAGEGIGYPLGDSWASLVAQLVKNPPAVWETWFSPWVVKIPWKRKRLPTLVFWPGEFHGLYSPWDHKESDATERLSLSLRKKETEQIFPCGAELLQETRENKME